LSETVWEDPPPIKNRQPGKWVEALEPLKERPGAWARIYDAPSVQSAYSVARNLRHGLAKKPPGQWEFRARDGKIYARYLGE
jgi:hypothetical protein